MSNKKPTIELLESIRRIVYRWVNTQTPLTADVAAGATVLYVESTKRWAKGDQLAIIDYEREVHEPFLVVDEVVDDTTLTLSTPIRVNAGWTVANNSVIRKTHNGKLMEGIYIGDPAVIPQYPAITIMEQSRSSNFEALNLTKENHSIQIASFTQATNNEDSYRFLLSITDNIERGLKNNFYPFVGSYDQTQITADIAAGDRVIKVDDSSIFEPGRHVLLDSLHRSEESSVKCIVDATTIELHAPFMNAYTSGSSLQLIAMTRFFYNSWPADIDYGFIHKGSLLHASTISYFAWEAEIQEAGGWLDPVLS